MSPIDAIDAKLIAQSALLTFLVRHAKANDPTFEEYARSLVDTALGQLLEELGPPPEKAITAREHFMELISTPAERNSGVGRGKERPKKLTLRRRFLNWLERG
jgi:hypothetical protein